MGGLVTLLTAVAVGISFGWRPAYEGGIEYIIPVSHDRLEPESEEIAALVPTEPREQVSRLVLCAGQGTPPAPLAIGSERSSSQISEPPAFSPEVSSPDAPSFNDRISKHWQTPAAKISEPWQGDPIPGHESESMLRRSIELLKPQNPDNADSEVVFSGRAGMGLPNPDEPVPTLSSLDGGQLDSSSEVVLGEVSSPGWFRNSVRDGETAGALISPPSTRSPSSIALPSVAQNTVTKQIVDGSFSARVRPDGPTTEPTNPQETTWSSLPFGSSSVAADFSSDSGDENRSLLPESRARTGSSISSTSMTQGLRPSDTFGQLPKGVQLPAAAGESRAGGGNLNHLIGEPVAENAQMELRGDTGRMTIQTFSQEDFDNDSAVLDYRPTSRGLETENLNAGGVLPPSNSSATPDFRLTPQQIAIGAWGIDSSGRLYDRQGRFLTGSANEISPPMSLPFGSGDVGGNESNSMSDQTPFSAGSNWTNGQENPPTGNDSSATNNALSEGVIPRTGASGESFTGVNQLESSSVTAGRFGTNTAGQVQEIPDLEATSRARPVSNEAAGNRSQNLPDPPSLASVDQSEPSESLAKQVPASQPQSLINGVLLISLVANIYLIFWLKRLRLQFRDLVAVKRLAKASSH